MKYQESKFNRFDAPVPGESLTSTPKNYMWEKPPHHAKNSDAFEDIWNNLHKEPMLTQVVSMLDTGVPAEALAKTILFTGFTGGKFSVDTAILIAEPVFAAIVAIGKVAGLKEINLTMDKENPMNFASQSKVLKEVSKQGRELKKDIQKVSKKEPEMEEEPKGLMSRPVNIKEV